MSQRVFDLDVLRGLAVGKDDLNGIGDRAFVRIEIVARVARILDDLHARSQLVDERVRCGISLVVLGRQFTMNQGHRDHVLQAVVTVGGILKRAVFRNDANGGFLSLDANAVDLIPPIPHRRMQTQSCFDGGLPMKLGRKRHLEEDILHHVAAEGSTQPHVTAAKQAVLKAPRRRGECGRRSALARECHQREPHRAAGCITRSPALARAGVRSMAVRSQRASIEKCLTDGRDDLISRSTEHPHRDGGRCHADQDDVVDADSIEGVLQSQHALNLIRLDHGRQDVADVQRQ